MVVTGRTDYKLALDRTVAARARRVHKAKVRELQKTDEVRGRGPAPALLVAHLRAGLDATPSPTPGGVVGRHGAVGEERVVDTAFVADGVGVAEFEVKGLVLG